MTGSYYFWKWADNDLPGPPAEVHAALLRGEMHPAIQPFDARPLLKKLEAVALSGRGHSEEWDWESTDDGSPLQTSFVFVTGPRFDTDEKILKRFSDHFQWLGLSGFDEKWGDVIPLLRPKLNCFITGQYPRERSYDISIMDLPYLIRRIDPHAPDPFDIIEDRRGYFVQCRANGRRFCVEWAQNHYSKTGTEWDQCRAQDRARLVALDIPYHKNIVRSKNPDLLLYADTLRIFQAFVSGEPRPARYHWMNINSWLSKK